MRVTPALISVLCAAVLLGAGCGDDGGGNAPSKQEFANKADDICADVSKQVRNIADATTPAELEKTIVTVRSQLTKAIERLDKLDRPNGNDGKLAQQWIDELRNESDQIDDALGDLQKALKDRDPNAIRAAGQKLQQLDNKRFTELSKQLGMSSCAS